MVKHKWNRDTGKPYIRRANGRERATGFKDRIRLTIFQAEFGPHGFYVLVQRRCGNTVMAIGLTRADIIASLVGVGSASRGFSRWTQRIKHLSQGRRPPS